MKEALLFLPRFGSGGAETFVVNVAIALKERGWATSILSIDELETVYDERLQDAGVPRVTLLDVGDSNPAKLYAKAYRAWARYLRENHGLYDVIHFNVAQGEELPFVWMAKRAGVPVRILHSHNSQTNSRAKYWGHLVCKRLFPDVATHYVSCSDVAAEWNLPARVVALGDYLLMNNGISTADYAFNSAGRVRKRSELGIEDRCVYLNVGRLHRQKNQMFLLDVFALIVGAEPDAVLLVAGTGELEDELKTKTDELGLADKVIWLGARSDIRELYWAADVFMLPSIYEGFPFTLIEAQAAGLPCVVSDQVSAQCAITDRCLYSPLDEGEFAEVSMRAAQLPLDGRAECRDAVAEKGFDVQSTVAQLLGIYAGAGK